MKVMLRPWESQSGTVWHWSSGEGKEQCWLLLQWINVKGCTASRWCHLMASLLDPHMQDSLCLKQKNQRQTSIADSVTNQPVLPQSHVRDSVLLYSARHELNLFLLYKCMVYVSLQLTAHMTVAWAPPCTQTPTAVSRVSSTSPYWSLFLWQHSRSVSGAYTPWWTMYI